MKKWGLLFVFLILIGIFSPRVFAHELFIQVVEESSTSELRVDVMWGHLRDFVDQGDHDNYELLVRYPSGDTEELGLEKIGVQSRAYVSAAEEGEYVFWAIRNPSTYTPDSGITQKSMQMAKHVYMKGSNHGEVSNEPVHLTLEIVPDGILSEFDTGTFTATVFQEGNKVEGATVNGYGPKGEILEAVTDENGWFSFDIKSYGEWLFKANKQIEEAGQLGEESYERISQTTTLLFDNSINDNTSNYSDNIWTYISILVIGWLLGASLVFLFVRKRT